MCFLDAIYVVVEYTESYLVYVFLYLIVFDIFVYFRGSLLHNHVDLASEKGLTRLNLLFKLRREYGYIHSGINYLYLVVI